MNTFQHISSVAGTDNQLFPHKAGVRTWLPAIHVLLVALTAATLALLSPTPVLAKQADSSTGFLLKIITPSSVFLQAGAGENQTSALVAGATWDLSFHRPFAGGNLSAYSEASFGRWSTDVGSGGSAWVTQLGITPVLRWSPSESQVPWFIELGVGANVILPIYNSESKKFSTAFNFGDHAAIGLRFGERRRQEIALRVQHFSNAGIREPNPGENFLQLRWSHRW